MELPPNKRRLASLVGFAEFILVTSSLSSAAPSFHRMDGDFVAFKLVTSPWSFLGNTFPRLGRDVNPEQGASENDQRANRDDFNEDFFSRKEQGENTKGGDDSESAFPRIGRQAKVEKDSNRMSELIAKIKLSENHQDAEMRIPFLKKSDREDFSRQNQANTKN